MKRKLEILFFVILLFNGCSPDLGKEFYESPSDILIQRYACYFPNGYNGMASENYPGVLAIVKDNVVFDADGAGSRYWMAHIKPFKINISRIKSIKLSEKLALNRKVLSVFVNNVCYDFYMIKADSVYNILEQKIKK